MEKLEVFLKKKMEQHKFSAMMIPRYLEKPNAFLGSKKFTLEEADQHKKEAKKCEAVLIFLKNYNKEQK